MKMKFATLILIFLFSLFLSIDSVNALTRPLSVPCDFEAEIIDYEKIPAGNTGGVDIEKIELTLKIFTYGPPAPGGYRVGDDPETLKQMCSFPSSPTIQGSWYPPGQPYTQDREPGVDKNKVLTIGSTIKGGIDSYDSIITNVSLVKEATQQDNILTNKDTNPFVYIIVTGIIVIILLFFIKKHK